MKDEQRFSAEARKTLRVLFAATVIFTLGEGSMQVLIAAYLETRGLTQSVIGQIAAASSACALLFRFITGSVYRPERTVWLVPGGCVLQSLAFLLIAQTGNPVLLAVLVALNGAGLALASTGGLAAIMDVTDGRNAGSVMGWYTGFVGIGYAASGFLGGWLGDQLGLPMALTVLAIIPLVAALGLGRGLRFVRIHAQSSASTSSASDTRPVHVGRLASFRHIHASVWLAAAVGLQINLVSGVLLTFFPLYGLAIGLSLTQIGALSGFHSSLSSAVRFVTPLVFRRVEVRSILPWMVILSGLAVMGLTISEAFWALAASWLLIGFSRGFLRVGSATLVTQAAKGPSRGAASGIYLAGLDLGKVIGPIAGGIGVEAFGYRSTFLGAGMVVPLVYFLLSWLISRRADARAEPTAG